MLNQEYVPYNKQIHIKLSEEDLERIRRRMEQVGVMNMSAYIRKMAIDGYYIHVDLKELLEVIRLLRIDGDNINQIAKVANACGEVDAKTISEMKSAIGGLGTSALRGPEWNGDYSPTSKNASGVHRCTVFLSIKINKKEKDFNDFCFVSSCRD